MPSPKSMKWGSNKISFARPIRNIILMLDSEIVPFTYNNLVANNKVVGNRYLDVDISGEVQSPQEYFKDFRIYFGDC